MRLFLIAASLFLFVACSNSNDNAPLLVSDIALDGEPSLENYQLVISFNQPIAIVGDIPKKSQLDAIKMSNGLADNCIWRYLDTTRLACEFRRPLDFYTAYSIEISSAFMGLGISLSEQFEQEFSTKLPNSPRIKGVTASLTGDFPEVFEMPNYHNTFFELGAVEQAIILKNPNNEIINYTIERNARASLFRPQQRADGFIDGKYTFILPKGFQDKPSRMPLKEDLVIAEHYHSNDFTFWGIYCADSRYLYHRSERFKKLVESAKPNCPPENLLLGFSRRLLEEFNAQNLPSALTGGKSKWRYAYVNDGIHFYTIQLSGETRYELDFSVLNSEAGAKLDQQNLVFTTQASTPLWQLLQENKPFVEAGQDYQPIILRRKVDDFDFQVAAITDSEMLLRFLNGKLRPKQRDFPAFPESQKQSKTQDIDIRAMLNNETGLLKLALSGASIQPAYYNTKPKISTQQEEWMSGVQAFNLAIWQGQDLFIQAIDWHANYLPNVTVELVCEDMNNVKMLGSTNNEGGLLLKQAEWKSLSPLTQNKACWLWAEHSSGTAAFELKESPDYLSLSANAWTSQPLYQQGEKVHIGLIAKQRSADGLVPVLDKQRYSLLVKRAHSRHDDTLFEQRLSELSRFGFASLSFDIESKFSPGNYALILRDDKTQNSLSVGEFLVAEYQPPEFEFTQTTPKFVFAEESFIASIEANRMNGVALENAKARSFLNFSSYIKAPETWPKGYSFTSYNEYRKYKTDDIKAFNKELFLDTAGSAEYRSLPLNFKIPVASLRFSTELAADDGETQSQTNSAIYLAQDYILGSKFDANKQQLELIAIDVQGNEIRDVSGVISKAINKRNEEEELEQLCAFERLPHACSLNSLAQSSIELVIDSTRKEQKTRWYREHYISRPKKKDGDIRFELMAKQDNALVGQKAKFSLRSPHAGVVTLKLMAGEILETWQQEISAGENEIEIEVSANMAPYFELHASKALAYDLIKGVDIQKAAGIARENIIPRPPANGSNARLLVSSDSISVLPSDQTQSIEITSADDDVAAGETISLSLTSNQDTDAQLWLVNDALLALMSIEPDSFKLNTQQFDNYYQSSNLASQLFDPFASIDVEVREEKMEAFALRSPASPAGSIMVGSYDSSDASLDQQNVQQLKAQSKWLETISLSKGKTKTIRLQLPALIGRWRIIALSSNNNQSALATTTITTSKAQEYFIDLPSTIYEGDEASIGLNAINRKNAEHRETLSVYLGSERFQTIDIALAAKDYQRRNFDFPALAVGKHQLIVRNENNEFIDAKTILVKPRHIEKRQAWLMQKGNNQFRIPSLIMPNSLATSIRKSAAGAPAWDSLLDYNKHYEHVCWEQTLSRALSYSNNPQAETLWSEGKAELKVKVARIRKYQAYGSGLSYFPNKRPDAFLTAYTYLVLHWLEESNFHPDINKQDIKQNLLDSFVESKNDEADYSFDNFKYASNTAKSMMLWALAENKDISFDTLKIYLAKTGVENDYSRLMQILALKAAGAASSEYLNDLRALSKNKYQDTYFNIFNDTAMQCMAAMAFEPSSKDYQSILQEINAKQLASGHFGTTFANAICSQLLQEKTKINEAIPITVSFDNEDNTYKYEANEPHWLEAKFRVSLNSPLATAQGMQLERQLFVRKNGDWVLSDGHKLKVGDIVKYHLHYKSGTQRQHVALSLDIGGAIEAINPSFENQHYIGSNKRDDGSIYGFDSIREGKAFWYFPVMPKGDTNIRLIGRVRHTGHYLIGPAHADAMYREDVEAVTNTMTISIE